MDMVIETMKDGRGKEYLNALHLLVKVLKLFIIKSINSFFFHLTLFPSPFLHFLAKCQV